MNYFVSPSGNDSQPGTQVSPWKTLPYAIAQLKPGDTLKIRGGTYRGGLSDLTSKIPSGLANALITIEGFASEPVILTAAGARFVLDLEAVSYTLWRGLTLDTRDGAPWQLAGLVECNGLNASSPLDTAGHHNRYEYLDIIGSGNIKIRGEGVVARGSDDVFLNLKIHDFSEHGMYIIGNRNLIDGCDVYANGIAGGAINETADPGHGIQIYNYGDPPKDNILKNSKLHRNRLTGLQTQGPGSIVYNNLFYENGHTGAENSKYGAEYYHNTFANNLGTGLSWFDGTGTVRNNLMAGNRLGDDIWWRDPNGPPPQGLTQSNNIVGPQNFVNAAAGDFRLLPGSSAIGAGVTVQGYSLDRDDVKRKSPPSAGAYEVAGAVVVPPVTPPTQPKTLLEHIAALGNALTAAEQRLK